MKEKIFWFFFLIIFLSGTFLFFWNLNWDENNLYHPDERNIANAVAKIKFFEDLNPKFFAYNSFPIYLTKLIGYFLSANSTTTSFASLLHTFFQTGSLSFLEEDSSWMRDWSKINLITRFLSALSFSLSILIIFLIGKKLMGKWGGLLSAFFFSFSPTFIQQAHFGTTEGFLVLFLLLISFFSLKILETRKKTLWIILGIFSGLTIASKISAISFLIIPGLSWLILVLQEKKFLEYFLLGFFFLAITIFTFFVFSPYAIFDFPSFRDSLKYEYGVVSGKIKVPYNWQFYWTLPYFFFFKNLHWQTNLILPTLGFIGIFIWLFLIIFKKEKIDSLPLLSFAIFYFLYVGRWYTKFIRYMVPFIPLLILGAVWILIKLLNNFKTKVFGIWLSVITFTLALFWSIAFFSIYTRPHTRIVASKWIYENIPFGSRLLHEHWDDRLPGLISGYSQSQYEYIEMRNYEPDTLEKIQEMAENLSKGDYLIISSRRLSGSIGINPQEWPITSKYYRKLFEGKLGYQLIAIFSSYPKIFGLEINDDSAEETFQVYDHPKIFIFKNEKRYDKIDHFRILFQ